MKYVSDCKTNVKTFKSSTHTYRPRQVHFVGAQGKPTMSKFRN